MIEFLYIAATLTLIPLARLNGRVGYTEPKGHFFAVLSGLALVCAVIFGLPSISGTAAQSLFFFTILICVSAYWSDMPYFAIGQAPQWAGYCLLFLMARTLPVDLVLICLYVPSIFIAAYGLIHQVFARDPINMLLNETLKKHKSTRMYATLGNSNYTGAYLAPQVFAGLWLGLNVSPWFYAPLVLIIPALVLSKCRAALISTILAFCVIPDCWPYVVILGVAFMLVTAPDIVLAIMLPKRREKYASLVERFAYIKICWAMIKVRPFFGWGPDAFRRKVIRVQQVLQTSNRHKGEHAHNDWLEIIVETGLAGFALFGLFAFGVISTGLLHPLLLAGFIACLINAGLFFTLRLVSTALPFFIFAAVITGHTAQPYILPLTYSIPLAALVAYLTYCLTIRPIIAIMIFNKFDKAEKKDPDLIAKAIEYSPYENLYLTTAAQLCHHSDPVQALHLHSKVLQHYDGKITEWAIWNNYARAAGNSGAIQLAERAFATGLSLDPTISHLEEGLKETRRIIESVKKSTANTTENNLKREAA